MLKAFGLATLLCVAACGPFRANPANAPALIRFTNEGLDEATVYVYSPATDFRRIGVVFPGRTETLKVPADLTRNTVNIVARMLQLRELPQTGSVTLVPGESYDVRLPPDAKMLTFLHSRQ